MARKQIANATCDRCGDERTGDFYELPRRWSKIARKDDDSYGYKDVVDLCGVCTDDMLKFVKTKPDRSEMTSVSGGPFR